MNIEGTGTLVFRVFAIMILVIFLAYPLAVCPKESVPTTEDALSLEGAIAIALKTHPSLAISQFGVKVKEAQLGQARAGYFPKVDVSTGFTRNFRINDTKDPYFEQLFSIYNQNTGKVSFRQTIFDFGRTPTNVAAKKLDVQSSRMDLDDSITTVVKNVKSSYYALLKAKQSLDVNREAVMQYEKHLSQATAFFEGGTKPRYDVTKAEVDLSSARLDLIDAENSLNLAWVNLNNAMGIDVDRRYRLTENLPFEPYTVPVETILETAYRNRPDLKSLFAQKASAEQAVALAQKEYYPQFTGSAEYNAAGSRYPLGQGWLAGISMSLNLFDGLSTTYKVAEAAANVMTLKAKIDNLRLQVMLDVKQAYLAFVRAREAISTTEVQMRQARENLELANLRYESGLGNPVEVTDATVSLSKAKLSNIGALYDYMTARANIEKAMGNR